MNNIIIDDIKRLITLDIYNYLEGCYSFELIEPLLKRKYLSLQDITLNNKEITFHLKGIDTNFKVKL